MALRIILLSVVSLAISGPLLAQTATATASSQQPGSLDAARSSAANPENQRDLLAPRGFGAGRLPGMLIQGDGIGLPPGVGRENPAAPRTEQEKEKKAASAGSACVGPNRDSQGCVEKESDPLARRIDQGLERSPDTTRPTDMKVQGSGIATPRCFGDSRDGMECSN